MKFQSHLLDQYPGEHRPHDLHGHGKLLVVYVHPLPYFPYFAMLADARADGLRDGRRLVARMASRESSTVGHPVAVDVVSGPGTEVAQ